MRYQEILARISGFSTPGFGLQWNPPEPEVLKARRLIAFFEDRRVLYSPGELEVPEHCVQSVLEIRRFLSKELESLNSDAELAKSLRAMRAACRKFLDHVSSNNDRRIIEFATRQGHYASWEFYSALGEMRGQFGLYIAIIAATYRLDVEDDLAKILPEVDKSNDDDLTSLGLNDYSRFTNL